MHKILQTIIFNKVLYVAHKVHPWEKHVLGNTDVPLFFLGFLLSRYIPP